MALLEGGERVFVLFDLGFKLLDVLCSSLSEGGLRLSITLLSLFRGRVYLPDVSVDSSLIDNRTYWLASALAFRWLCSWLLR